MNTVKFKKYNQEELKTKMIMLRASNFFGEQTLILIEKAIMNQFAIELDERQIEMLESLNLLENVERQQNTEQLDSREEDFKEQRDTDIEYNINGEKKSESLNRDDINITEQEDEGPEENFQELSENNTDGEDTKADEKKQNINFYIQAKSEEKEQERKKEEEQKKFVPQSPEDIANIPPEMVGKMFYLTPERIIESMKRLNGGAVWKALSMASKKDSDDFEVAIKKAYELGLYESDLRNPNFLDERVSRYLPEENQAVQLKELHLAALMGTYVGYHVEKTEGDVKNINANGVENSTVRLKFPMLVSEMPEALKEQSRRDIVKSITREIEARSNTSDSRRSLKELNVLEDLLDETIQNYSESLHETEENKAVKAYIKTIRTDLSREMKDNFDGLKISMDFYDVDWSDPSARRTVLAMIKTVQKGAQQVEVGKLLEDISMSFTINSEDDISKLEAACHDLSELANYEINVNISIRVMDPELNEKIEYVVNRYSNITRNTAAELSSNIVNGLSEKATEAAVIGMSQEKDDELFNPMMRPPLF